MTIAEKLPKYLLGAVLLGVTASTLAVSLGRMRGTAIVGRSFDVTLLARLGVNERLSAVCVEADVFLGDSPIPPSRVRIDVAAGANAGEALIRVRTASAVDEPVVTVSVREGCLQKYTRKYVFLAEVLTGKAGDLAVTSGLVEGSAPVPLQLFRADELDGKASPSAGAAQAQSASSTLSRTRAVAAVSGPPASAGRATNLMGGMSTRLTAKSAPESAGKSSRSRLKIDMMDLTAERDPVLRSSSELLTQPSADAQQQAIAAALWHALSAQPQDMLRDSQRLKSLEEELAKMQAQSRMADKAASELRVQLEQSRRERFSNWLVYTLAGLLALTWLTATFLWVLSRREQSSNPWWRHAIDPDDKAATDALASEEMAGTGGNVRSRPAGEIDPVKFKPVLNFEENDRLFNRPKDSSSLPPASRFKTMAPIATKDRVDFSISLPSMTGMPRIVNAEELFDVQQQADFFVSLGDFDKATEVLRSHIADNVETSALAYLDLFDLYHRLGRKADYEILSADFSRIFNAKVPPFDSYTSDNQGLEFYTTALSRIESLWPTPKVLEVIEESIFRKPDSMNAVFSLAAYRELLLLHAIAKQVVDRSGGRKGSGLGGASRTPTPGFVNTNMQPLSAELQDLPKLQPLGEKLADPRRPPASRHLGLDIDLSLDFVEPQLNQADAGFGINAKHTAHHVTHELPDVKVYSFDRFVR